MDLNQALVVIDCGGRGRKAIGLLAHLVSLGNFSCLFLCFVEEMGIRTGQRWKC